MLVAYVNSMLNSSKKTVSVVTQVISLCLKKYIFCCCYCCYYDDGDNDNDNNKYFQVTVMAAFQA